MIQPWSWEKRESPSFSCGQSMSDPFIIQVSEREIRQEKEKARALRKTRWWQQRLGRGICHYCGKKFPASELTMDHIVPLVRGGKSTRGNVAPACRECNSKKKYLLPMEWEEYLQRAGKEE
jgi:5-methylcytosine-specific restriction endonuclease McrA